MSQLASTPGQGEANLVYTSHEKQKRSKFNKNTISKYGNDKMNKIIIKCMECIDGDNMCYNCCKFNCNLHTEKCGGLGCANYLCKNCIIDCISCYKCKKISFCKDCKDRVCKNCCNDKETLYL